MIFWLLFVIFAIMFIISFIKERRLFRNAIFFSLLLCFLFLAVADFAENTALNEIVILFLYILVPLCLLFVAIAFILAGVISIKKEGFSLPQTLSILFGLGLCFFMFISLFYLIRYNLSTITSVFIVLLILISAYIIFTFFSLLIYSFLYRLLPKNVDCDFIIVHGAGLLNGNQVSVLLARRLDKGIEVYNRSNQKAKLIVSGGQGADETVSEAQAMKEYLLAKGIREEAIILENKSTTTLENMQYSKKIMDSLMEHYKTIFVTNDYHVFRTGTYAKKVGLQADGIGCKTALYYWPNAFIREYVAIIIKYKVIPIVLFVLWLLLAIISMVPYNF